MTPQDDPDPIANTQMFRAFAAGQPEREAPARRGWLAVLAVVLVAVVAAVIGAWLALR